jgi:hypothetical protein
MKLLNISLSTNRTSAILSLFLFENKKKDLEVRYNISPSIEN